MLSMLGLGAALGFTLSGVLEPLEAEAQEAAPATPNPTAPATGSAPATGTRGKIGGHRDAPLAISDGAARHGKPAAPAATAPAAPTQ